MTGTGSSQRSISQIRSYRRRPAGGAMLLDRLEMRTLMASNPVGSLDAATVNEVAGWAYDADDPNARLQVNVKLVDNGHSTTVIANVYRGDLTMLPDTGHGYALFTMSAANTILTEIAPGTTRSVSATAVNVGGGASTVLGTLAVTNHVTGGSVDVANGNVIAGWAYDPDSGPNKISPDGTDPIYVTVVVNGVTVSRALASNTRADLSGYSFGANHGYSVDLSGLSFSSAPTYQVWFEDSTALYNGTPYGYLAGSGTLPPVVASIQRWVANPTNATSVVYGVTFSQPVTGVDASDFALVTSGLGGASISSITGSGATYYVTVNTGTDAVNGTVGLNLVDNDSIAGSTGLKLAGTGTGNGNFTGQVFTIDRVAPTIQGYAFPSGNTASAGSNVTWVITFTEAVTGVDASDFTGIGSGGVTPGTILSVTGSGNTYYVTVNSGTGTGQLALRINDDGTIRDGAGNLFGGVGDNSGVYGAPYMIV